ncbi:MAG: EAL domain-containing protein [Spirochaetales bacterium]
MIVDYTYQYQYEFCSLIFLVFLSIQYFVNKRFPSDSNKLFTIMLAVAIADLTTDILGCMALERINEIPVWINYLVNGLFYCLHIVLAALMCTYVFFLLGFTYRRNKKLILVLVPGIAFLSLMLTNPFTGLMFSIREIGGVMRFRYGPLNMIMYVIVSFYFITMAAFVIMYRRKIAHKQIMAIIFFCIILISALLIQLKYPTVLFTGTAIAISIVLWDLTLQSPDDMLDEVTGAYDDSALRLYLAAELRAGHIYATVVDIDGLSDTQNMAERGGLEKISYILAKRIGKFFLNVKSDKVWFFRESNSRFWVMSKNQTELEETSTAITNRFRESWNIRGVTVDLLATVLYFSTNTSLHITSSELISIIDETFETVDLIAGQKNRIIIDSAILAKYRRRHVLYDSLRHSIKTGEGFYLCFQPIIGLRPHSPVTAEVLLRYNDQNLGMVSPAEFIPIIEKNGLSMQLNIFVVDSACRFLAQHPEVELLHINLSATEFFMMSPAKRISGIVRKNGIDPKRICFEITESAATNANIQNIISTFMNEMISLGFSFALDDYGTGYSNVQRILKMPFSTVKVDRTFLTDDARSIHFLEATIKLFLELGIEPVMEGVETEEQLERVASYGVTFIQGFLFSRPLVGDAFIDLIKSGKMGSDTEKR